MTPGGRLSAGRARESASGRHCLEMAWFGIFVTNS